MVQEYMEKCYGPSAERFERLTRDNLKRADEPGPMAPQTGTGLGRRSASSSRGQRHRPDARRRPSWKCKARVNLGSLSPDDVEVQLFHGVVDNLGEIPNPATAPMSHNGPPEGNAWVFKGKIPCRARAAWVCGAGAAEQRGFGQSVRAGVGVLGVMAERFALRQVHKGALNCQRSRA